jgi:hypothetical protein
VSRGVSHRALAHSIARSAALFQLPEELEAGELPLLGVVREQPVSTGESLAIVQFEQQADDAAPEITGLAAQKSFELWNISLGDARGADGLERGFAYVMREIREKTQ